MTTEKIEKERECYANAQTLVDLIDPANGLTVCYGKTLEVVRSEHPDAERMTVAEFCRRKAEQQRTPITWTETTEERYYEMLSVLPPACMRGGGFLVGEPYDHDAGNGQPRYDAFRSRGGRFEASSRPLTVAEFRLEVLAEADEGGTK